MNERTKVALIGGLIAGVLSGLPVISGCCFLWALIGGFVTVFLYLKNAPGPLAMGDAAKIAALAGAIGAAISLLLGFPFMLLGVGSSMATGGADLERAGISAGIMAVGGVVGLLLRAGLVVAFAVLGGIIAAAVLGKKAGTPPPPPPSTYGGTTPPSYGGPGGV